MNGAGKYCIKANYCRRMSKKEVQYIFVRSENGGGSGRED
jgi:hypothetical protein